MYFCAGDDNINIGLISPHQEYMFIIGGNKIWIWQQYDSMMAVELRGVHMIGRAFLYGACSTTQGLHAVLLSVGIM